VSALKVRRLLTGEEVEQQLADPRTARRRLLLADDSALDPATFQLLIGPQQRVVAYSADLRPVELEMDSTILERLTEGCKRYGH
jgi:hypothetical protein